MLRFGVVGAGWFASRRHLPELAAHPEVELRALCRRSVEPLHKLADHFHVPERYTDLQQMLSDSRLEAVLISSPHDLHHAHAAACLDAGLHVLMEKPMSIMASDARDLVQRAEAAGKLLEVCYNPPYWQHTCWLRDLVADGDLGELETVDLRWTGDVRGVFGRERLPADLPGVVPPTMFRADVQANGGGHLIDSGSHHVAEVVWVTGQPIREVTAVMDSVPDDLRYLVGFSLANGALGSICSVGDSRLPDRRVLGVYQGSKGSATVSGMPFVVTVRRPKQATRVVEEKDMPRVPQPVVSFVDAVLGRAECRSPGRACVGYVEVVEAAYRAAESGTRQRVGL